MVNIFDREWFWTRTVYRAEHFNRWVVNYLINLKSFLQNIKKDKTLSLNMNIFWFLRSTKTVNLISLECGQTRHLRTLSWDNSNTPKMHMQDKFISVKYRANLGRAYQDLCLCSSFAFEAITITANGRLMIKQHFNLGFPAIHNTVHTCLIND